MVHTAGGAGPDADDDLDLDLDDLDRFDAVQRTDVRGTFLVARQAARWLRDGGAIVNLSGAAPPRSPDLAHAASRSAVEAMTRALAHGLRGRDITVNAVTPQAEGPAVVEAMAHVVLLLVGADGRGLDGQIIRIDAGAG